MPIFEDFQQPAEPEALKVPDSYLNVLAGLGATVLTAIDAAIATAITQATQQLATATVAYLERALGLATLRAQLAGVQAVLDTVDQAKAQIDPFYVYLDLVPEVKKPIAKALNYVDNFTGEIRSMTDRLNRMTYMTDYANGAATELSGFISELLSTRALLAKALDRV